MSILRRPLNFWLRTIEKPRMRNGSVATLRRALRVQSRLFFHPPRGTKSSWREYGGIRCLTLFPRGVRQGRVLFYIHGGGFVFGSPDTHSAMAATLAQKLGAWAVLPRYRLAPESSFPAAPDDVRQAWDGLIASGVSPANIVVGGDSAGGALALGLISALCAEGAEVPSAMFAFSPLTDLTFSGASIRTNAEVEAVLAAERGAEMVGMYLNGRKGADPEISPLYASFQGGPPVWITVGDTEILLDDGRRMIEKLQHDKVEATLVIADDLPHVWPIFHNILPEARETLNALASWIKQQQNWAV
ncbi:alpha/beta hydrolase [uncultured Sulfitobacter sp.]|uniref:alpha/beta hydrolase n=1 Tax=uncultured Sulfitobacter sp. TaxID=191468 RepID=UPI002631421A|nr:alpha/beta hydrolase [uncultured Sulfitobacter sp.]